MKISIGRALAAILLMAATMSSFAAPAGAAPLDDANAAAESGDYTKAVQLLRPLADQGDRDAQYNLGIMYFTGQASRATLLRLRSGLARLPSRDNSIPNTISASCTNAGWACRKTMPSR